MRAAWAFRVAVGLVSAGIGAGAAVGCGDSSSSGAPNETGSDASGPGRDGSVDGGGDATFTGTGDGAVGDGSSTQFGDVYLPPNPTLQTLPQALPDGSVFTPPPANACDSSYDHFYATEPGVYAYWALCEPSSAPGFYDYVGPFDLTMTAGAFGGGTINRGAQGPVADGETAATGTTIDAKIESQDIPLNNRQGTLAVWLNADATQYAATTLGFSSVDGKSLVSITIVQDPSASTSLCVAANFTDQTGAATTVSQCGVSVDAWHRAVMTWTGGTLKLYVDGASTAAARTFTGSLDNTVYYYQLFPGSFGNGGQMTLAKALVANTAWEAADVTADFAPTFLTPPSGGVLVTAKQLGTIHRDILGYGDVNADLSDAGVLAPLVNGLAEAGVTSVRYASSYGGITADFASWDGGVACTTDKGKTDPPENTATDDNLVTYESRVVEPLGLHLGYTVNYGTNPPACNAGGDPIANGADLVQYANGEKKLGIKYWEIGNEQYSNTSETDFHADPNTGASYDMYEPAFYTAMKAQDPTIEIGIPATGSLDFDWDSKWTLPVIAGASYDAVVFHNYPMRDPITDGDTLYQDRVASSMDRTRGELLALQTELLSAGKSPDAIWVTEWSGCVGGDMWSKQTLGAVSPLFAAIQLAEYMRVGVQYATWWAQGSGAACLQFNYDYNGEGAYSWTGECGSSFLTYTGNGPSDLLSGELPTGMKPADLAPGARAFQMLSASGFVTEGEHMLDTVDDTKNAPWLLSYAATHGSSYAVILVNRDRDSAHIVPVTLSGASSGGNVLEWTWGREQYDQAYFGNWEIPPFRYELPAWSGSFPATLPPWSVSVFVFGPG